MRPVKALPLFSILPHRPLFIQKFLKLGKSAWRRILFHLSGQHVTTFESIEWFVDLVVFRDSDIFPEVCLQSFAGPDLLATDIGKDSRAVEFNRQNIPPARRPPSRRSQ